MIAKHLGTSVLFICVLLFALPAHAADPEECLGALKTDSLAKVGQKSWPPIEESAAAEVRRMAACTLLIAREPGNAEALRTRGFIHYRVGDFERAIADFDRAVAATGGTPAQRSETHRGRGYAYYRLAFWPKGMIDTTLLARPAQPLSADKMAEWEGQRNAELVPARAEFKRLIGLALADYDEAVKLDPDRWFLRRERGMVHWFNGEPAEAIADYAAAVGLADKHGSDKAAVAFAKQRALLIRALASEAQGDRNRALADYTALIADFKHDHLLRKRAELHRSMSQFALALEDINAFILKGGPSDLDDIASFQMAPPNSYWIVRTTDAQGGGAKANALLVPAKIMDDFGIEAAEWLVLRARLLAALGRKAEAIADYRAVLDHKLPGEPSDLQPAQWRQFRFSSLHVLASLDGRKRVQDAWQPMALISATMMEHPLAVGALTMQDLDAHAEDFWQRWLSKDKQGAYANAKADAIEGLAELAKP